MPEEKGMIQLLLENWRTATIAVTPEDLEKFAIYVIAKAKEERQQEQQLKEYMLPDEVAELFGITRNSLWRWDKQNYLKPVRCGRRLHYKRSEVMSLFNGYQQENNEDNVSE